MMCFHLHGISSCTVFLFKSGLICKRWVQIFLCMMMGKVSLVARRGGEMFMNRRILCKKNVILDVSYINRFLESEICALWHWIASTRTIIHLVADKTDKMRVCNTLC